MGTHALTLFSSREFDGEQVANVSPIWRKFDGHPTSHGRDLIRALSGKNFYSISELIAATWKGLMTAQSRREFSWQFCPVLPSQKPSAEWRYTLSLKDENGELPRGGPCMGGPFFPWLKVQHARTTLFDGPIHEYAPDDDPVQAVQGIRPAPAPAPSTGAPPQLVLNLQPGDAARGRIAAPDVPGGTFSHAKSNVKTAHEEQPQKQSCASTDQCSHQHSER